MTRDGIQTTTSPDEIGIMSLPESAGTEPAEATPPTLSVIIPVYNSDAELEQCLNALAGSGYDDFDVLVVDDGSTIPIEALVVAHGFEYLRIDGPGGPARARNRGAAKAQGRFVVFIDADVCVHTETLSLMAGVFAGDPNIDAVVGSYDDDPTSQSFISQYKNLFHHYVHDTNAGEIRTFWTGCGAMKRDLFLASGGFDQQRYRRPAVEDIELGTWLSARGHRIILDRRIKARHLKRWTFWKLLKSDIFDRGVPWVRLMLRAGAMAGTLNDTPAQRFSVVLAYLTVLALAAAAFWPAALILATASAFAVTLLNAGLYIFFAKRRGLWFALRAIPMHWLYFLYCGLSAILGILQHYLQEPPVKKRVSRV